MNEDWANVVKTAEFINNRRIAAAWIPSRKDNKDNEHEIFGGNTVFREVIQEDGTLNTKFPAELFPATGKPLSLKPHYDAATSVDDNNYLINSPNGTGAIYFENIPQTAE